MKGLRLLAPALLLAACVGPAVYETDAASGALISANYRATDSLLGSARPQLDPDKTIIVATIVDIDDLERSSTLGRFVSESVSARFTQSGYRMVEMKFQNAVYMKSGEGELMLTRQIREIANSHQAQAVIVGTYSRALSAVMINLKVVRPESNVVIAAQDYAIPMSRDVCVLLYRDPARCPERR